MLRDLSKASDCILNDLFIAKLSAYGFSDEPLANIFPYHSERKQPVEINIAAVISTYFIRSSAEVYQVSIFGPILFNIFINDLILSIRQANFHNYADHNTFTYF